ncbi:MAG: type II CAAX endopeptidase family protein [Kiritimatiellae bacterium]|nr:type II CAAX endopeptidase family protein [Kiritimatiellia bacterium]
MVEAGDSNLMLLGLRFVALVFFGGAVTLDLYLLFKCANQEQGRCLPFVNSLKARSFALPVAALALVTTLGFTVPVELMGSGGAQLPESGRLVAGSLVYAGAAALVVLFAGMVSRSTLSQLFTSPESCFKVSLLKGVVYGVAAIPPIILVTVITGTVIKELGLEAEGQSVIEWLTNPQTTVLTRIAIVFCAVVVAPVIEEVIFRGILFPAVLKGRGFLFSALLVGCVFSLIHFHAPSFLSILLLNVFFCAGYAATGSLVTPIVMHMVFNGSATCFALLV